MRLCSLKTLLIENKNIIYEKAMKLTDTDINLLVARIENAIKFTAESACIINDEKAVLEYLFLIMEDKTISPKRTVRSNDVETIIIETLRRFNRKQVLCYLLGGIVFAVISFGVIFIWRKLW